jgi:hypothetical protein
MQFSTGTVNKTKKFTPIGFYQTLELVKSPIPVGGKKYGYGHYKIRVNRLYI